MSLQTAAVTRRHRSLAVDAGLATAVLVAVFVWRRLAQAVSEPFVGVVSAATGGADLVATGLLTGGTFLAGLLVLAGGYAVVRDVDVSLAVPGREDLPAVAVAALVPVVLVGLTKLVGLATGVPYSQLTGTAYAADPPLVPVASVVALGVLVGVPGLVVVCQVVVQGSLARTLDGRETVVATTLATGFLLTGGAGSLEAVPDRGKLAGAAVFVLLAGVAVAAADRTADPRLRVLAGLPAAAFVAVALASAVLETDSLAAALFGLAHLAVLAAAAATYERTDSLVVPAVAYLSLTLSTTAVVLVFETGLGA